MLSLLMLPVHYGKSLCLDCSFLSRYSYGDDDQDKDKRTAFDEEHLCWTGVLQCPLRLGIPERGGQMVCSVVRVVWLAAALPFDLGTLAGSHLGDNLPSKLQKNSPLASLVRARGVSFWCDGVSVQPVLGRDTIVSVSQGDPVASSRWTPRASFLRTSGEV